MSFDIRSVLVAGALAGTVGACATTNVRPPVAQYPEAAYRLPDGTTHVVVGQTREGLLVSSREASAYHCGTTNKGPRCVPVPLIGGSGPGLVPAVAGIAAAATNGHFILAAAKATKPMNILIEGSANYNANLNGMTQVNDQRTLVNTSQFQNQSIF